MIPKDHVAMDCRYTQHIISFVDASDGDTYGEPWPFLSALLCLKCGNRKVSKKQIPVQTTELQQNDASYQQYARQQQPDPYGFRQTPEQGQHRQFIQVQPQQPQKAAYYREENMNVPIFPPPSPPQKLAQNPMTLPIPATQGHPQQPQNTAYYRAQNMNVSMPPPPAPTQKLAQNTMALPIPPPPPNPAHNTYMHMAPVPLPHRNGEIQNRGPDNLMEAGDILSSAVAEIF